MSKLNPEERTSGNAPNGCQKYVGSQERIPETNALIENWLLRGPSGIVCEYLCLPGTSAEEACVLGVVELVAKISGTAEINQAARLTSATIYPLVWDMLEAMGVVVKQTLFERACTIGDIPVAVRLGSTDTIKVKDGLKLAIRGQGDQVVSRLLKRLSLPEMVNLYATACASGKMGLIQEFYDEINTAGEGMSDQVRRTFLLNSTWAYRSGVNEAMDHCESRWGEARDELTKANLAKGASSNAGRSGRKSSITRALTYTRSKVAVNERALIDSVFIGACAGGHVQICKSLLPNVTKDGRSNGQLMALHHANKEVLATIGFEYHPDEKWLGAVFRKTCIGGFTDIVNLMVNSGHVEQADLITGFQSASLFGHAEIVKLIAPKMTEMHLEHALEIACKNYHTETTKVLLGAGAVNCGSCRGRMCGAKMGLCDTIRRAVAQKFGQKS